MKQKIIDVLVISVMVIFTIIILPLIMDINLLKSFKSFFEDFNISDIGLNQLRETEYPEADSNIVLINISNIDNNALFHLLQNLEEYSPKVIGLDKADDFQSNNFFQDTSSINLLNYVNQSSNIICTYILKDYSKVSGRMLSSKIGYNDLIDSVKKDYQTVREYNTYEKVNEHYVYSFAVKISENFNSKTLEKVKSRPESTERIFYKGNYKNFYSINSLESVHDLNPGLFKNKILLLSATDFLNPYKEYDKLYFTPLNERSVGRTFPDMYNIEIQANIISSLISNNYYTSMTKIEIALITVIIILLNIIIFRFTIDNYPKLYELISLLIVLIQTIIIIYLTIFCYRHYNYIIDLSMPIIGTIMSLIIFELYTESLKPIFIKAISKYRR